MRELTNIEHEKILLGALMLDNTIFQTAKISRELFSNQTNLKVFAAITELIGENKQANILTVHDRIDKRFVTAAYLSDMTNSIAGTANSKYYIESLSELSCLRRLAALGGVLSGEVVNESRSSKEIVAMVESGLLGIALNSADGYKKVSELLSGVLEEIRDDIGMFKSGKLKGLPSGFESLDRMTQGFQNQEMIIIGARPGSGKTAIALNIAASCLKQDRKVGFFSAEMSSSAILRRLISYISETDGFKLRSGALSPNEMNNISQACYDMSKYGLFINDTPNIKLSDLFSDAKKMKRQENIDLLVIDYLGLLNLDNEIKARHEQVSEMSRKIKGLARELNIPIIVLSQLTRDAQGKRPNLAQLRDSGSIEQDGDVVMLMWNQGWLNENDKRDFKVTMIVEKNRNGSVGDVDLIFRPAYMRFKEGANYG